MQYIGDETKNGKDVITRVLEYILDCNKTRPELTGCVGVVRTCIPYMSNQFRVIQKLYKSFKRNLSTTRPFLNLNNIMLVYLMLSILNMVCI